MPRSLALLSDDILRLQADVKNIRDTYIPRTEVELRLDRIADKVDFLYKGFWVIFGALIVGLAGLFFNLIGRH